MSRTAGRLALRLLRAGRSAAIVVLLIAAGRAGAAADPNVLFNSELDEALLYNGWAVYSYGAVLDWTGQDSTGCPGSGSAQVDSGTTDVGTQWAEAGQCQPFDASWTMGLHAAFSYFSFDATMAYIQLFYYDDAGCGLGGGNYLGFSSGSLGATGAGWHRIASSFPYAGVPATTHSVFVAIGAEAAQPTPMELLFDRAFFGRVPVIFADGFEAAGSPCRWSL